MSEPTREEVLKSIVVNSDQLNADDLVAGPVTVTIEKVSKGDREQPIHIALVGYDGKTFRPCKTVRRILIAAFSDDPKKWVGQKMTLFCDPTVKWAGVAIGGIRISHLSGLEHPRTFMMTTARGKRAEVTIHPIVNTLTTEDEETIALARTHIAEAASLDELAGIAETMQAMSDTVKAAVRPVYAERKKELEQG